jgi:hypothetical protein
MTAILILSFDMAPSGPRCTTNPRYFEERWLDRMVPLRHRNNLSAAALSDPRDNAVRRNNPLMKRLLLIGFAACTFALAPILSASAMPSANPKALVGADDSIIRVHGHGGGHGWRVVEATTMDGVEAIIMVITIGETSLPLMLNYSGRGRLWAAFSLVAIAARNVSCWHFSDLARCPT